MPVFMIGRHTSRVIDCSAQPLCPHLSAHPPAGERDHQVQNRDGDQREDGDYGDGHGRLLMVVRYGRGARLVNPMRAKCDLAHTAHKFLAAANRHLRAFWAQLIADEVCGRSLGYWLR